MINWIKTWIQKRKMIKAQKKYGGSFKPIMRPIEDKSLVSENDKEKLVLDMDRLNNVMVEGSYITVRQNLESGALEINCTRGTVKDGLLGTVMGLINEYNKELALQMPLNKIKEKEPREDKKEGYQ